MTREQAKREIDSLDYYLQNHTDDYGEESHTAMMMAIKALEQEPCEDAISRDDVITIIAKKYMFKDKSDFDKCVHLIAKQDKSLPSVTPNQEIGHWSRKTKVDAYDLAGVKTWGIKCQCDRCTFTTIVVEDFGYYRYCPNCGAKMERENKR